MSAEALLLVTTLLGSRAWKYPVCLERRRLEIAEIAAEAERVTGVPAGLLLVVGMNETHLGCARGEGGGWGAPVDRNHRHTAGTPLRAAQALQASYRVCGTWEGAVGRFRSGLCRPWQRVHRQSVAYRLRVTRDLYELADLPVPF